MDLSSRISLTRSSLNALFQPLFDKLCVALVQGEQKYWAPCSGLRSLEQQAALYAQGRTSPGLIVTKAPPGLSAHNWGLAVDFAYFDPSFQGQEPWDKADWDFYGKTVQSIPGLDWGGIWKFPDKPHAELALTLPYSSIGETYLENGEAQAWALIKQSIKLS